MAEKRVRIELLQPAGGVFAPASELIPAMPSATGRVMVVDDDALVRGLLRDVLSGEGHVVVAFASGAEALQAVPAFQPDVILVDMRMPGLSGIDVRDELQRTGGTVPVILITGTPGQAESGFFSTLTKPFSVATVAKIVAAAVNHRRTAGP